MIKNNSSLKNVKNDFEELSPVKQVIIKVILAIVFLFLLSFTVLATDTIIDLIKNLFTK